MTFQSKSRKNGEWPPRRVLAYGGALLGAVIVAVAVFLLVFGGTILNRYGKEKAEWAFAKAHPGSVLRIGSLDFAVGANRLIAQSVTLSASNTTLKAGRITLTGVRWARLLWGSNGLVDGLAQARLEATNLAVDFPQSHYGLRCARLRASVPDAELIAEGTELQPLVGDEEIFAAEVFRTTRYRVIVPGCRVLGLAYNELLQGKAYRARSVQLSLPSFDALVNCDKPPKPFVKSPLMIHEALDAIRQPLRVDTLSLTEGHITYCERQAVGTDPGVLTFGAVSLTAEGIANRGEATAAIQLHAQGDFMNTGTMQVRMTIPISSPVFSLHYSGSLGAMDLTRLNAFFDIAEHVRIKAGHAQEAAYDIEVADGQARGQVRAIYRDLELAVLGKHSGTERGLDNRVTSLLANVFKIRHANTPNESGTLREGKVNYTRQPGDTFVQFVWFALRTGVFDVISL